MDRKLRFWLQFCQEVKNLNSTLKSHLRNTSGIKFGDRVLTPEELEEQLMAKFNTFQIRKINEKVSKENEEEKIGE
jgi:hypothetical protein